MARYFDDLGVHPEFMFVEPLGAPSLKTSLSEGKRVNVGRVDNFVDGASVAMMGAHPFEILKRFSPDQVNLVSEDRICTTIIEMLNVEGIVLEPAGALAVDALKDVSPTDLAGKNVLCIASGGNFDFERLAEVKERALRFEEDDISRFEYLKKSARNFGSILIGIETLDAGNFAGLMARMTDAGIVWQDITDNELVAGLLI
ncbi:L-threonine dehydratase biosynthetic IlvA [Nymphon striatum]|nr:L-threonine dehydratase biosynthetic IlvA [Nymphon striatum]